MTSAREKTRRDRVIDAVWALTGDALVARVRELETLVASARRDGGDAMLLACIEAIEDTMPINNHAAGPVRVALEAIRALAPTEDR